VNLPNCAAQLRFRAELFAAIRSYFQRQDVMEVETPLFSPTTVPDPSLESYSLRLENNQTAYLQTSPELYMKRLLVAGSGSIYQLCKAFRAHESGHLHEPEFTLLEWYRVGYDHHQLMADVERLINTLFQHCNRQPPVFSRFTYSELFQRFCAIDPLRDSLWSIVEKTKQLGLFEHRWKDEERDFWLHLLMIECIEPNLSSLGWCFVHEFPESQASLARLLPTDPPVAARFELYGEGIELANGFYELQDAEEQRGRFYRDLAIREKNGQQPVPLDTAFIAALELGLPECAGVALGVDRLLMLLREENSIQSCLPFPFKASFQMPN